MFKKQIETFANETAQMLNQNDKIMQLMLLMKNRALMNGLTQEQFEGFKRNLLMLAMKIRAEVNPECTIQMAKAYQQEVNA